MKKKIILSSILALGVLGGVVGVVNRPVGVEAASITGGTQLYLIPGTWDASSARFAAYFFGNGEAWVDMKDSNGDGIFEVTSPSSKAYPNVIFCRMNKSTTANNWNNKWNQSGDLTWNGTQNLFEVTQWDNQTTGWKNYNASSFVLKGSFDSWGEGYNLVGNNGVYEYTTTLDAGNYEFKLTCGDMWLGNASTSTDYATGLPFTITNSSNSKLIASGGTYTFRYTYSTSKLEILHTPAANPDEDVVELFSTYYNEGSYVKETVLNTNEFADEDVNDYFHAGAQVKYRQTTYAPGQLSMVTKATSEAEWGTHTSTYKDNGTGVDHLTNGVKDYSVSGTVNGQDRSSVENWYVTLHDFVNTELTGWEYADGVYTLSLADNELATKMAREFVAPMWLETEEAKNYVQFDKLTVEEVGESLVMKLYVDSTNSGQLVEGANLVFSQTTITK